jgi:hypothetical protein
VSGGNYNPAIIPTDRAGTMSSFVQDNAAYEAWLASQCELVKKDLEHKHDRMRLSAFVFLRATYFRWATQIERICPELKDAPHTLCVGDAHLENFGTWRDAEGRLVWGVNDFDEAAPMPYAFDLVRLATSVRLAPKLRLRSREAADAILEGYREGLKHPRPTLLDEQEQWMRPYVACSDKERQAFWDEVEGYPPASPPRAVKAGLLQSLPAGAKPLGFRSRVRGGGSLGRARFVAIASYSGGHVVREAKALVPSAWLWAHRVRTGRSAFLPLSRGVHRSPDPYLSVGSGFVFRRVAADSRKVELDRRGGRLVAGDVPRAMGFDLAAIHAAGPRGAAPIAADLRKRSSEWLGAAAKRASIEVEFDFEAWRREGLGKD